MDFNVKYIISLLIVLQFIVIDGKKNDQPIIGILPQELSHHLKSVYPDIYDSYIAASYVKYLESSGARVVPLRIGQSNAYYKDILGKINGLLLPGGNAPFTTPNGYAESGKKILKIIKRMNDNGDYFPVWGTCLGFELLIYLEADSVDFRTPCYSKNIALPLIFKSGYKNSRLFKNVPDDIVKILKKENVTSNFHTNCITEKSLAKNNLNNSYRVLSLNKDSNDLVHISTIEHYKYPFYGTQYHPEKNNFEWAKRFTGIPHTSNAIKISQYFGNFFVDEARKNFHHFPTENEEVNALIYNYYPAYTGPTKSSFEQCYLFPKQN